MFSGGFSKPYLSAWLKRTKRELAGSGKLSEIALILSKEDETSSDAWRSRLQMILEGDEEPGFDLLTRIDSILARPARVEVPLQRECDFFPKSESKNEFEP